MKKILLIASIFALTLSTAQCFAAENTSADLPTKPAEKQCQKPCNKFQKPQVKQNKVDFDKRLKLTDEQKAKAKEIHRKGFEEIKPIMDKLDLKREEIDAVKRSNLSPEAQAEKIVKLRKESRELRRQTREIQMKNMKEFEAILTDKQKDELKKIKEEGRKKFEKAHKKSLLKMPPMPPEFGKGPKPEDK